MHEGVGAVWEWQKSLGSHHSFTTTICLLHADLLAC
jgi:hypothetical protein